ACDDAPALMFADEADEKLQIHFGLFLSSNRIVTRSTVRVSNTWLSEKALSTRFISRRSSVAKSCRSSIEAMRLSMLNHIAVTTAKNEASCRTCPSVTSGLNRMRLRWPFELSEGSLITQS